MKTYQKNVTIVLSCMKERSFSERSVSDHTWIYQALYDYLIRSRLTYSPELGKELLNAGSDDAFGTKAKSVRACSIAKLNDVYLNGKLVHSQISVRKPYSKVTLYPSFLQTASEFLAHCQERFSKTQLENVQRRVFLFLKFLQSRGHTAIMGLIYADILAYHQELSHLKRVSRVVEESSIYQFLLYLAEHGQIKYGFYLYMYFLETDQLIHIDKFSYEERIGIDEKRKKSQAFSSEKFRETGMELVSLHLNTGYVKEYAEIIKRAVLHLYLFLDLNSLGYDPDIADIWLCSAATKSVLSESFWFTARRFLFLFHDYITSGSVDFSKTMPHGISGLAELPDWCMEPLLGYADQRAREKLDECTIKNDIYSILRFCRFILQKGISSYEDVSGECIAEFNLADRHQTAEGKNACNARIRRFLKYLSREGIITKPGLHMAVGYSAAFSESIVVTLNEEELETARSYIASAESALELRDSAILLLGTEMGIRGCDIVNLELSDIDWKKQCICFRQDKTDCDVFLAMPVSVGNAIYRYLRDARPRKSKSNKIFVDFRAPYGRLTRHVCYSTLKRALPHRSVAGSGFHVTRKTFSTNRLKNGVTPQMIADAMGHSDQKTLMPYLSLDDARMSMCPLKISDLGITLEGGFQ